MVDETPVDTNHVFCGTLATLVGNVDAVSSKFTILHSVFATVRSRARCLFS